MSRPATIVRAEVARLLLAAYVSLRSGRRPWLACAAWMLAVVAAIADRGSTRHLLLSGGGVRADLPWPQEILRMPISTFIPTADLPLVASVAQILTVLALGEIILGRRTTLLVAALGQFISTLAARMMILAGAAAVIGLPASQAAALDTGPSGMTTAVGAWLLARTRCYGCLIVLGVVLAAVAAVQDNLDSREHMVAYIVGAFAAAAAPVTRRLLGSAQRYSRSGLVRRTRYVR